MTALLQVDSLDKHFGGLQVTRGVSLKLHAGDRLALIGPNGAGKTTLVNLISGVLAPSAGRVWLGGRDVTAWGQAARVRAGLATERLAYGQQRLVELALALALRPKVLLLDEPMAGVPQGEGQRLLDALDALPASLAVLIIEHDMDLVFRLARRIVVLAEGAVLADGTPEAIRNDPLVRSAYLGH